MEAVEGVEGEEAPCRLRLEGIFCPARGPARFPRLYHRPSRQYNDKPSS